MKLTGVILILSGVINFASLIDAQGNNTSTGKSCNGYEELCGKSYSSLSYVATHNSFSFKKNNPASNQNYNITIQLNDGVRALLLDGHKGPSEDAELCHNTCNLLDAGKIVDSLKLIVTFLQNNPNEVVTIIWENADALSPATYKAAYDQAGLTQYSFVKTNDTDWPTLSNMIQSGKRVVNFIDRFNNVDNNDVPWLMMEFAYVFEIPFENTDINKWQCTIDRPKGQSRPMYMLNHFTSTSVTISSTVILLPAPDSANITNGQNLLDHVQNCTKIFGKNPNFVAVDFYDKGSSDQNVFSVVAGLNGVQYVPRTYGSNASDSPGNANSKKNGANVRSVSYAVNVGVALVWMAAISILCQHL